MTMKRLLVPLCALLMASPVWGQPGPVPSVPVSGGSFTGLLNFPASNSNDVYPCSPGGGAACDGSTDDSAILNTDLALGRVVHIQPGKTLALANTVAVTRSNTAFVCDTLAIVNVALAPANSACQLLWTGASGGTMMSIIAPLGSTSTGRLSGNIVRGFYWNGNSGLAANGLVLKSVAQGDFSGNYFNYFNGGFAFDLDVVHATSTTFGSVCDSQFNRFDGNTIYNLNGSSVGLFLGTWQDASLPNGGCNASFNTFYNTRVHYGTGEGIVLSGADNNVFINTATYRTGTGVNAVHFTISTAGGNFPAQANMFYHYSGAGPIYADGQTAFPSCISFYVSPTGSQYQCTFRNQMIGLDTSNGTPLPTVEAGALLQYWTLDNFSKQSGSGGLAIATNDGDLLAALHKIGSASMYIINGSSNHIVLDDDTNVWGLNINSTTGLRFNVVSGSASTFEIPRKLDTTSHGVIGKITTGSAAAGNIGEYTSATATVSGITSATPTNVTSLSLTAGDWDVAGNVCFAAQTGTIPTILLAGVSTTSATLDNTSASYFQEQSTALTTAATQCQPLATTRVSITTTTTVYLVGQSTFTVGTMNLSGVLTARRSANAG